MTEALIELRQITKVYRSGDTTLRALNTLSLDIKRDEFVAVMGSSGSGKSTLMNIIGCLDRPTEGEYLLAGKPLAQASADERAQFRNQTLGFVFQNFNLLPRTTAIDNVELPLLYAGVKASERRARAQQALERVGLASRMEHHPNQLSGGQQQRVAIARALVSSPKLIVADEPTGNLDSHTSIEIMRLLQELWQTGTTIVLVTHEPDIATYASRVLVMRDGNVLSDTRQTPVLAKAATRSPA